jgi:threonine dehydrogenase-like Zn-dependent dehydrogenase
MFTGDLQVSCAFAAAASVSPMPLAAARAFWVTEPGRGEIRAQTLSEPGAGEVLVRALASGISRGTETLVFNGRVPPSEYRRMRAPFQEGDFPAPVKYGYTSVGVVEAGPAELVGRRVFCLYPHQDRYVVPADAVHPLPDDLPLPRALLTANLQTAINGIWDAEPHAGDRISVVGAGTVGCLLGWLAAKLPGAEVELVDTQAAKAAVAGALGTAFASPDDARRDADLVVHASGSGAGLATALGLAGFEATVVEMSWFGAGDVPLPLGEAFHSRRLTLRASQVSAIAAPQRARWDAHRRTELALRLLADPALDALITGRSPFAELPAVLAELAQGSPATLCHCIDYD